MDSHEGEKKESSLSNEAKLEKNSAMDSNVLTNMDADCSYTNSPTVSVDLVKENLCEPNLTKNDEAVKKSFEPLEVLEDKLLSCPNGTKLNEVQVFISKPLCADYRSDSESVDSESDSSDTATDATSSSDDYDDNTDSSDSSDSSDSGKGRKKPKEKEKPKTDSAYDLPLIEDLKITVPEEKCVEIGIITSIVDSLVVVESFKGSAALDIDTVLFLDNGKRTLGKVFDILGPVTEPVYTIRFNNHEQIRSLDIKKHSRVYYAPKTQYTNFVFMSEVLKNRGSDASWKDNIEAPPEFQDFSDDEEEKRFKHKNLKEPHEENPNSKHQAKSRKRSFKNKQSDMMLPDRFSEVFLNSQQFRKSLGQRIPSVNPFAFSRAQRPSQMVHPLYPPLFPPNFCYPLRFSRPSFSELRGFPVLNQQPSYQQTTQAYHQRIEPWVRPVLRHFLLPPPPPPPTNQEDQQLPTPHLQP